MRAMSCCEFQLLYRELCVFLMSSVDGKFSWDVRVRDVLKFGGVPLLWNSNAKLPTM